jgi:hypothetical protein
MVNPTEFKESIKKIISQEYQIEFLGDNFDKIVNLLTETKAEKIFSWLNEVLKQNITPLSVVSKKQYKQWEIKELLVFRYPMVISNNEYRILFVKVKNSFYIEFHLGDHKYYDKVRKNMDLKKSSY